MLPKVPLQEKIFLGGDTNYGRNTKLSHCASSSMSAARQTVKCGRSLAFPATICPNKKMASQISIFLDKRRIEFWSQRAILA